MAVVRALAWTDIAPDNPPTCLYVPTLTNCVTTGESMALDPPIMHNNVAFSFGRIIGAANLSAFFMQLICRPSDIGEVSPIIAPLERSDLEIGQQVQFTRLDAMRFLKEYLDS
jgi:hypothetical protein